MTSANHGGLSPIDTEVLKDLSDDPAELSELIELYLEQTRERIEGLRKAIAAGSANDVMRLAHTCAGSSGMYGMSAIEPVFRQLERSSRVGDLQQAPLSLEKICDEFQRIEQFWKAYQQKQS